MYLTRPEMITAAHSLIRCLEREADEDASQWALEIINGLYGEAVRKYADLRDRLAASVIRDEARP